MLCKELPNGLRTAPHALCGVLRWGGLDFAWEQEKLEARKMLENAARPTGGPQRPMHAVLGGSSLPCSITEVNCTIAKAAFRQKLELQSHVVRQG